MFKDCLIARSMLFKPDCVLYYIAHHNDVPEVSTRHMLAPELVQLCCIFAGDLSYTVQFLDT
jgi:hypothetical protein